MQPNLEKTPLEGTVRKTKLGEISINREAFELDLKINDGYQNYSAELLRLALLILGGLGAVWLKLYVPPLQAAQGHFYTSILIVLAFASTALSAGASLVHRYMAADGLAYQLTALRRRARNRPTIGKAHSDEELATRQEKERDKRFKWSGNLLRVSMALLFAGLFFFCVSMASLMFGVLKP